MQVVVANMTEYMELYRSKTSWLRAFTAFRLPSPLSASDAAGGAARAEVKATLKRICREAGLLEVEACKEVMRLLPCAENYRITGCHPRAACGLESA